MLFRILSGLFFLIPAVTCAQVVIPTDRMTDWSLAGNTEHIVAPENSVSIQDFGGDPNGETSCNTAFTEALAALAGAAGTIYFPEGNYLFNAGLVLPDSVFIQGESADNTTLRFETPDAGDLIRMAGSIGTTSYALTEGASRGNTSITLDDASSLSAGDIIRLSMDDEDLVFSDWAYGTVGQVVEVTTVDGSTLTLADPLNTYYPLSRNPNVVKVSPIRAAGVECISIVRADAADLQASNIYIRAGFNCVVRNVHSTFCAFAHVETNASTHITVEGCYFNQAIGYGGGGRGYGVMFQETSSFCQAQNNIFDRLRHSMIVQSGANGNVFSYNFSRDPYWTDVTLPANSSGDLVLHGNYPYMNLAEGNQVQNMVVDASHGNNGPFNTFFRNRGELYGFFSDGSTVTDSMNLIGNEITNSGFLLGLFLVNGAGHLSHGNNVQGTVNPSGTQNIGMESLLYASNDLPAFMGGELPLIGYPEAVNTNNPPAYGRYQANAYVSCVELVTTAPQMTDTPTEQPELWGQQLHVPSTLLPAEMTVIGVDGRVHQQKRIVETHSQMTFPSAGIHVVTLRDAAGNVTRWKTVTAD